MHQSITRALVASLLATASTSTAASHTAKNRCSDAVRILRQQGSMPYKSQDVDPLNVEGAKAHLTQVTESFERAKAQIKLIPQGEFDQKDPELAECWTTLRSWADYIMLVQLKMKQATEKGSSLAPFLEKTKPHTQAMLTLAAVELSPGANVLGQTSPQEAKAMLEGLAEVEKECAPMGPEVGNGPLDDSHGPGGNERRIAGVVFHDAFTKRAHNWCHVAKKRSELMSAAATNRGVQVEGFGNYTLLVAEAIKKTSAAHPDLEAWIVEMLADKAGFLKKREQAAKAWNTAAGVASTDTSEIASQLTELQMKVDAAAAQLPAPKGTHHDAGLESDARAALKRLFADAVPKHVFMDEAGWTIEKNGLGVPLNRFRSGQLIFKRPAFKFCEQRTFSYNEVHQGGGSYAKGAVKILSAVRLVSCP